MKRILPQRQFKLNLMAFTLVEVMVAAAVSVLVLAVVMNSFLQGLTTSKWQSAYETASTYSEQALEYALYVPYEDFSVTNSVPASGNWVSNGFLYTTATSTNYIPTTKNGQPYTLTNVTHLATQASLPLDDLGSYVVSRFVRVIDRTVIEPTATNSNYKLIQVSNVWVFQSRPMPPMVFQVIRDQP